MMSRLLFAISFVAIGVFAISTIYPATGQDRTVERLSALETQVAELDDRVQILEGPSESSSASDAGEIDDSGLSFEGTGLSATDIVELSGAYQISASCSDGFLFTIDPTNVDRPNDIMILNLIGTPPFEGATVESFEPGRYIFAITCDGTWTLTFEPLT